jgi:hypothetical protein
MLVLTIKVLLWFQCPRCDEMFRGYGYGYFIFDEHIDFCFYDNRIGEIHCNSYLRPITQSKLCSNCKKGGELEDYF